MSYQNQYQPDVEENILLISEILSLIETIESILREITDILIKAKHNIKICSEFKKRVCDADFATVFELKVLGEEFFNEQNYYCLQRLVSVIRQIKNFVAEISQIKTLSQAKSIEKNYLYREFENCLISLDMLEIINIIKLPDDDDEQSIKSFEEFEEFGNDLRELQDGVSSMTLKLDELNEKTNKASNDAQPLKISDFKETGENPRKGGRVTKWIDVRNKCGEFAFKDISEYKNIVQNQVTILKELHDCQSIIKFYGITCDGNKWYSVTEWAEYGNLREFYTNRKNLFNIRLKLRMSLDIARGLNFLRSLEIVHRDIRAENILVTLNDTAKLANFQLCRTTRAATFTSPEFKQNTSLERVRYCAPELLSERTPYHKYDYNCEVYSFGILLWEIAEEKTPYKDCEDIVKMTNLVREKCREPFSENSAIPEKFKNLSLNAVNHDPESRPKVATMFEVLFDCFESFERTPSNSSLVANNNNQIINTKNNEDNQNIQNCTPPEFTQKHSLIQKIRMRISKNNHKKK